MDTNEIETIKRQDKKREIKDWLVIVSVAIALSLLLAGCGGGDPVVTPDPVVDPVDNAPEPVVEPVVDPEPAVDPVPEPPVVIVPEPVAPVVDPVEPEPVVPVEPDPPVVVEPDPVAPDPVIPPVVVEPVEPDPVVVVPDPVVDPEPEPFTLDREEYFLVFNTIQNYLEEQAKMAFDATNQMFFTHAYPGFGIGQCTPHASREPFVMAQTTLECTPTELYLTLLGDLTYAKLIRTDSCVEALTTLFDSSSCILDSTDQSINAEYEIFMVLDDNKSVLYIVKINAPLGEDECTARENQEPSPCPEWLVSISRIITGL